MAGVRVSFHLYLSSWACGACVCVTREREEKEEEKYVSNEKKGRDQKEKDQKEKIDSRPRCVCVTRGRKEGEIYVPSMKEKRENELSNPSFLMSPLLRNDTKSKRGRVICLVLTCFFRVHPNQRVTQGFFLDACA